MKYKDLEKEWSQYWFQYIKEHPDKPWNWKSMSGNPNITWEIIQQNPDKEWDWRDISSNENITWEFIQQNPDKPWCWRTLSENQNITWDIVETNPDKPWDWSSLSENILIKQKETFIDDLRLKIIKSNIIKRYWTKYSYNPIYPFAQKMILKRAELM